MRWRFGDFELDVARRELRRGGAPLQVEPQVFDVIQVLIEHHGQVVSQRELLEAVWHDRIVGPATVASRINAARRAVGDDGRRQAVIATIHGRGYRWLAPVQGDDESSRQRQGAEHDTVPTGATWPFAGLDASAVAAAEVLAIGGRVTLKTLHELVDASGLDALDDRGLIVIDGPADAPAVQLASPNLRATIAASIRPEQHRTIRALVDAPSRAAPE